MIQIKNVSKYYEGKQITKALEEINVTFPNEGMVFIVGKSGSGKSTLLNLIGGLDVPTNGDVIIDNKSLKNFTRADLDAYHNSYVGIIFQSFHLLEESTVYENIALSLKIKATEENINDIEDALKNVGLEGMGYRRINELSGGQKQRIAIARVLVKNPRLIIADEPTGSLDSTTGEDIVAKLKVISKNRLVIVVTHDRLLAQKYGNRIIEISDGHIVNDSVKKEGLESSHASFIAPQVVKIPIGGSLPNAKMINEKLNQDVPNYLCLSSAIEKVALAYPETFSTLYEKQDYDEDFLPNDVKLEEDEEKKISLVKSRLPLKEALKMTSESLKRKRVRFASLVFLSTIAITLFSIATSLTSVTNTTILASTIKAKEEKILSISKSDTKKPFYNESDYTNLATTFPDIVYGKSVDVGMQFVSANPPAGISEYYLKSLNGVIENNDIEELGLKVIAGNGEFSSSDEGYQHLIISDYVASEFMRQGFVGEKAGKYGIYFPLSNQELVGCKVLFKDGNLYTIKGVFQTDYQEINQNESSRFKGLKSLYYGRAIVRKGFVKSYLSKMDYYAESIELSYNFVPSSNRNLSSSMDGIYDYDPMYLEGLLIRGTLPETLKDNEVVIDLTMFNRMMNGMTNQNNNYEVADLLDDSQWNWYARVFINPTFELRVSTLKGNEIFSESAFKIVAIVSEKEGRMYFSENFTDRIIEQSYSSSSLVTSSNHSVDGLTSVISAFKSAGYQIGTSAFSSYDGNVEQLRTLTQIALLGAGVCGVFALLLIINFIFSSIKNRQKEIAILRSCGARPIDVAKIFLSEIILTALIVSLLAVILTWFGYSGVNLGVSSSILRGMSIVTFRVVDAIKICAIAFISMVGVALVPIIKISYLKPIDALNASH